jgi:hypothetical protein
VVIIIFGMCIMSVKFVYEEELCKVMLIT